MKGFIGNILEVAIVLIIGSPLFMKILKLAERYTEKHKEKFDSMNTKEYNRFISVVYVGGFFVSLFISGSIAILVVEKMLGL